MATTRYIITSEHASDAVPPACASLLKPFLAIVEEHQIYDRGTIELAEALARSLKAPLFAGSYTRLAIDLNRSTNHPDLFGAPLRAADPQLRLALTNQLYAPFRSSVAETIQPWIDAHDTVIHFSIHSFTPVFLGHHRTVDFGVLFDPARTGEADLAEEILKTFQTRYPKLRACFNEPYAGTDDGHTTALRALHPSHYIGIELEYSQRLPLQGTPAAWALPILQAVGKG